MSSRLIHLQEFEHVEAVPGKALLRIVGQPEQPLDLAALVLVVQLESGEHRVSPLPAPASPSGVLRLGFTVPAAVADGALGYSLVVGDGEPFELPAPTKRQTARITEPLTHSPAAAERATPDTEHALADLSDRLHIEMGRRLSAEKAAAASAAARSASAERVEMLEAELVKLRDEVRSAHAAIELGNTQANQARTEAEAAETALARRDAEIDLLRSTLAERTSELSERTVQGDAAHAQWEQITAELTAEIELARAESAQFQRAAADLELVLVDTRLELETLQMMLGEPSGSTDPNELRRALNAAAAEIERLRAAQ